jgi:hypothetical protein
MRENLGFRSLYNIVSSDKINHLDLSYQTIRVCLSLSPFPPKSSCCTYIPPLVQSPIWWIYKDHIYTRFWNFGNEFIIITLDYLVIFNHFYVFQKFPVFLSLPFLLVLWCGNSYLKSSNQNQIHRRFGLHVQYPINHL